MKFRLGRTLFGHVPDPLTKYSVLRILRGMVFPMLGGGIRRSRMVRSSSLKFNAVAEWWDEYIAYVSFSPPQSPPHYSCHQLQFAQPHPLVSQVLGAQEAHLCPGKTIRWR
jgi:hypothetical protein